MLIAGCEEPPGGESGGEAKRAFWNRGLGSEGCEESQERAVGSSIVAIVRFVVVEGVVVIERLGISCDCDRQAQLDAPVSFGAAQQCDRVI